VHAGAAGQIAHRIGNIGIGIIDHMVAAERCGDFGFFIAAGGADHGGAQMLCPLAENVADAAGGGMHQYPVAGLNRVGAAAEVPGGQAAHHDRGGGGIVDTARQVQQTLGGHQPLFGVAAGTADAVGHPLAGDKAFDAGAGGGDHAGAFAAQYDRQIAEREAIAVAGALLDLGKIDADGGLL
jgi:hypothetical protein